MLISIDLPDGVHRIATSIAQDAGASLSETFTQLLRTAIGTPGPVRVSTSTSTRTGLRVASLRQVVTSGDVRSLDDE